MPKHRFSHELAELIFWILVVSALAVWAIKYVR